MDLLMNMLGNMGTYEAICNRTGKRVICVKMKGEFASAMPKPLCYNDFNCSLNCECNKGTIKSDFTILREANL